MQSSSVFPYRSKSISKRQPIITLVAAVVLSIAMVGVAAAQGTGEPLSHGAWTPSGSSTNALNYAKQVPVRPGQSAPYVLFNSNGPGTLTLDFYNHAPGLAAFEYRIDGEQAGTTEHPVVGAPDTIHPIVAVATQTEELGRTFNATSYVDIRLALGGERDWDFDWVRFTVLPLPPADAKPVPALSQWSLLLLSGMLAGLAVWRRKKTR